MAYLPSRRCSHDQSLAFFRREVAAQLFFGSKQPRLHITRMRAMASFEDTSGRRIALGIVAKDQTFDDGQGLV
jgi:hypothetical protein